MPLCTGRYSSVPTNTGRYRLIPAPSVCKGTCAGKHCLIQVEYGCHRQALVGIDRYRQAPHLMVAGRPWPGPVSSCRCSPAPVCFVHIGPESGSVAQHMSLCTVLMPISADKDQFLLEQRSIDQYQGGTRWHLEDPCRGLPVPVDTHQFVSVSFIFDLQQAMLRSTCPYAQSWCRYLRISTSIGWYNRVSTSIEGHHMALGGPWPGPAPTGRYPKVVVCVARFRPVSGRVG